MATEPAFENLDQHPKPQVMTQIRKNSAASTGEVERAYNICSAQQSVRFPQDDVDHSVLVIVISQIILELGLSPEILT